MLSNRIAVDLGTAYSLVAHQSSDQFLRLASSIAFDRGTGKVVAFGDEARRLSGRENLQVEVVHPLRDGVISNLAATNLYLNRLIDEIRLSSFAWSNEIYVCLPWGATSVEMRSYAQGLKRKRTRVHLVREPFAAALGCDREILESQYQTVMDLGGGTTEIATICGGLMIAATSMRAGGNYCDELVQENLRAKRLFEVGLLTAEEIKKTHASVWPIEHEYEFELKGLRRALHLPESTSLHTEELRSFLEPYAVRVEWVVSEHLRKLPDEARNSLKMEGLWMAGGGALIQGWKNRLESRLGIPVHIADKPTHCVIRGLKKLISDPARYESIIRISEKVYSS